jgi:4-hydroxy-2-oxoheptanedioate aldolase
MMKKEIEAFREKLEKGTVIGLFSKTNDPGFIETAGYAGFDYVIIDLEHAPNSVESIQNLIRAAQISGILPIVRVKEGNPSIIGESLDIGAAGIQVPQITSAEQAEAIMRLAKFAPLGERGVCRFVRAALYSSMNRYEYFKEANKSLIILQLEGKEAIRNLDRIIEVDGVDVLFIGPYDLSQSLGVAGQIDHPLVEEKMNEIIIKCKERGKAVGTFADTIENACKWRNYGIKYIAYSVDIGLFYEKCKSVVDSLK